MYDALKSLGLDEVNVSRSLRLVAGGLLVIAMLILQKSVLTGCHGGGMCVVHGPRVTLLVDVLSSSPVWIVS